MSKFDLNLPQGILSLCQLKQEKIIVVAGGRRPEMAWLKEAAATKRIFCADHGIDYCYEAGILPDFLCGDRDSASQENWLLAQNDGAQIKTFAREKDDTDLQLLLKEIPENSCVLATGIWGGRFDHLYANIFSLLACKKQKSATIILADHEEIMVLLGAGEQVTFVPTQKPTEISLLPFASESKVSISGVKWPLNGAVLSQNHPYAISNELTAEEVTAGCESGFSGFYLKFMKNISR